MHAYLWMRRIGRMIRVLRRLRQLRHIDVVGSLCVARIDVGAWDAVGLLARHEFISSFLFFSFLFFSFLFLLPFYSGKRRGAEGCNGDGMRTGS